MRKSLVLALLLMSGLPVGSSFAAYAAPAPQQQSQTAQVITGTVLDENDEPVIGASVVQKGVKTNAVATDYAGNFKIKVVPGAMLEISYVGYKAETMAASNGMTVYLQPTTEQLNELVAIGYGSQKKANLTGAVATVDVARTMESRPVQDVTKALQGAVPGLTITNTNGGISSNAGIRIRGVGTLSNSQNSSPLLVVDGVPVDNLNFINPEDIQDISVLKDASSSAIYGARAAFGVVLITTKGASKKDKVSVSYTNNFAWSSATVLPNFAPTVPNIEASLQAYYRNPTASNSKTEVGGMLYTDVLPLAKLWAEQHDGRYTDYRELHEYVDDSNVGDYKIVGNQWIRYADWDFKKLYFNNAAPSQKHNVTLEGTSGKTQYRLAFGYDGKQGLENFNPDKMSRYMASANISTEITSWLKAGTRINYTQREYTEPNTPRSSYQYAWRWAPYMETYGWITNPATNEPLTFRNDIMNRMQAHTDKAVSRSTRIQAWLNAEIIKGLNLQADFTYDVYNFSQKMAWLPQQGWNGWGDAFSIYEWPTAGQPRTRASKVKNESDRWTVNVFATYAKSFADSHNLKVMVGGTAEQYRYNNLTAHKYGLVDYSLPEINLTDGADASSFSITSGDGHRATAGFFGRINYDYKGIYLFEANGRYDGSTRFPANCQWAFFPSFSAGYRFSEEGYFEPVKDWWSNGKLRVSYGHLGNENVGTNMFLPTITLGSQNVNWLGANGSKINSASTPKLVSSTLTWERIITTDVGVDFGFFQNSLNVSFDWYSRETKDMLAPGMPLPSVLGASAPLHNAGDMRTNGWEFSVGFNHSFGDWNVWANASLADARSKVTKWNNDEGILYSWVSGLEGSYRFYEGQYYGDIWGFSYDRYFEESDFSGKDANGKWIYAEGVANQDYLAYNPFTFGPGDVKFKDLNGDGVINNGNPDMKQDAAGNTYLPGDAGYDNPENTYVPVGTEKNHGDLKVVGNAMPRYEYSFRLGASWKGFDLDLFFQGIGQRKMWQVSSFTIPFAAKNDGLFEHQLSYNKYITDANGVITGYEIDQNNDYPAMYSGAFGYNSRMRATCNQGTNNFTLSDRYLVNMAYLRMKNITFGYTIPANLTTKAYIQKARVYFSAENPFFIYNGAGKFKLDPEIADRAAGEGVAAFGRTSPIMRSFSFGIQVTF